MSELEQETLTRSAPSIKEQIQAKLRALDRGEDSGSAAVKTSTSMLTPLTIQRLGLSLIAAATIVGLALIVTSKDSTRDIQDAMIRSQQENLELNAITTQEAIKNAGTKLDFGFSFCMFSNDCPEDVAFEGGTRTDYDTSATPLPEIYGNGSPSPSPVPEITPSPEVSPTPSQVETTETQYPMADFSNYVWANTITPNNNVAGHFDEALYQQWLVHYDNERKKNYNVFLATRDTVTPNNFQSPEEQWAYISMQYFAHTGQHMPHDQILKSQ